MFHINKHFFTLAISTLVSLFIAEKILTDVNYPYVGCPTPIYQSAEKYLGNFDPESGWSYKGTISYTEPTGKFAYHFDEHGFRVNDPLKKINFEKPRILFIGGSLTFGEGLNFQDAYATQIGELLGNQFEVVNLGVQGYGTAQSLMRLKKHIDYIQPSYIVYTFIPDHINRNVNYDRRLHIPCISYSGTKPVFSITNEQLKLERVPAEYSQYDKFKTRLLLDHGLQRLNELFKFNNGQAELITKALIREIENTSKNKHAKSFYIYYDTNFDKDNLFHEKIIDKVFTNDTQRRLLNFSNWAKDADQPGTKYFVNEFDDYHPNATVSAMIAEEFVNKFSNQFLEDLNPPEIAH